jgi:hypothetical protein
MRKRDDEAPEPLAAVDAEFVRDVAIMVERIGPGGDAPAIKRFARGWNEDSLKSRILSIRRFYVLVRDEGAIPLDKRTKISRLARELLKELDGLGGWDKTFWDQDRGERKPFREMLESLAALFKARSGRGGDHRSGERGAEQSVLAMLIRLYIEANADKVGFSKNGPLVRFVNTVGKLTLGTPDPFSSDTVRAEFQRVKEKMPKFAVPHTYREQPLEAWELAVDEMISERRK